MARKMIDINQTNLNSLPQQVEANRIEIERILKEQGSKALTVKCADAELQCAVNTYNLTKVKPPTPKEYEPFIKRVHLTRPTIPISIADLLDVAGFYNLPDTTLFFANVIYRVDPEDCTQGKLDSTVKAPSPIFFVNRSHNLNISAFESEIYHAYAATNNSTLGADASISSNIDIEIYAIGGHLI